MTDKEKRNSLLKYSVYVYNFTCPYQKVEQNNVTSANCREKRDKCIVLYYQIVSFLLRETFLVRSKGTKRRK